MLTWLAETLVIAAGLATIATLVDRWDRVGPATRHLLWLVVLWKLLTPPVVQWPNGKFPPRNEPQTEAVSAVLKTLENICNSYASKASKFNNLIGTSPRPQPTPSRWVPWAKTGLLGLWIVAFGFEAVRSTRRIARFRHRLRQAESPPDWLTRQVEVMAERLGVHAPPVRVLPGRGSPLLWCFGQPTLVLPADLLRSLPLERWRGVLAHELAHLKRGDPWVARLAALAGLLWWWNPLYRLTCRRLEATAELACDAHVIHAWPEGRRAYAEALLDVCESQFVLVPPGLSGLSVGMAGRDRPFLERRLRMIMRKTVNRRVSLSGLLAALLLGALAFPSWSAGRAQDEPESSARTPSRVIFSDKGIRIEVIELESEPQEAESAPNPEPVANADPEPKFEVGSVNLDAVLQGYDKYQEISRLFQEHAVQSQKKLEELRAEIKQVKLVLEQAPPGERHVKLITEEDRAHAKRHQELQRRYDAEREALADDFTRREARALAELYREIRAAIAEVAQQRGMTYVVQDSGDEINEGDPKSSR